MDKLPVPRHLRDIADVIEQGEIYATLRLLCPCGCRLFRMERAEYSPEERAQLQAHEDSYRAATEGYRVKHGANGLLRKRGLFGRWEPAEFLPCPACYDVTAIRAVCEECGVHHLVFDNRLHGFEAACGFPVLPMDCKPLWEVICPGDAPQGCQIEVFYGTPRELFEEDNPGVDYDNAFDKIDICSRNAQGHLKPLLCAYA